MSEDIKPQAAPEMDYANLQVPEAADEEYLTDDDLDMMLDGFTMDDIDEEGLDYDPNNENDDLDAQTVEKIRMAMAQDELANSNDKEMILMAAAGRIALRKGIPRVPSIFGSPSKCKDFVEEALQGMPPPTHGMLDTAQKVFEMGDMAGLAITSMEDCRKYLLAKAKGDSPSTEMLDKAFNLAQWHDTTIPPKTLETATQLEAWIKQHEG